MDRIENFTESSDPNQRRLTGRRASTPSPPASSARQQRLRRRRQRQPFSQEQPRVRLTLGRTDLCARPPRPAKSQKAAGKKELVSVFELSRARRSPPVGLSRWHRPRSGASGRRSAGPSKGVGKGKCRYPHLRKCSYPDGRGTTSAPAQSAWQTRRRGRRGRRQRTTRRRAETSELPSEEPDLTSDESPLLVRRRAMTSNGVWGFRGFGSCKKKEFENTDTTTRECA